MSLKPTQSSVFTILFIAYLSAVATLTMIPSARFNLGATYGQVNIIPVVESYQQFWEMIRYGTPFGIRMYFQNLLGNIIMFVPFGAFATLLYKMRKRQVVLWAFVFSATLELTQYSQRQIAYFRHVDVDDILLNVAGALAGYALYKLARKASKYIRLLHRDTAIDNVF